MLNHFFHIFLFLGLYKQSTTEITINPIRNTDDKLNQEKFFEQKMAILKNSFENIASELAIENYNKKKLLLEELKNKVDSIHKHYRDFKKLYIKKLFPERKFNKYLYLVLFFRVKCFVTEFKIDQDKFIEIEKKRIYEIHEQKYIETINSFLGTSDMVVFNQKINDYLNDLRLQNNSYYFNYFLQIPLYYKKRYDCLYDFYSTIIVANERAIEIINK